MLKSPKKVNSVHCTNGTAFQSVLTHQDDTMSGTLIGVFLEILVLFFIAKERKVLERNYNKALRSLWNP